MVTELRCTPEGLDRQAGYRLPTLQSDPAKQENIGKGEAATMVLVAFATVVLVSLILVIGMQGEIDRSVGAVGAEVASPQDSTGQGARELAVERGR